MSNAHNNQVFYDPKQRRWRVFIFGVFTISLFFIAVLSFLAVQIMKPEKLPAITVAPSEQGEVIATQENGNGLKRWSTIDKKKVALTFDDGPDKRNTPHILDILKDHQVPATFFIVGQNANDQPQLLHRMFDENHEIANHTYTHLNSEKASTQRIAAELNATQKLLEAQLGVKTLLFRAPYSDDHEPRNDMQLRPVKVATELGYVSVGMKVDPKDWKAEIPESLAQKTITAVKEGKGNIVLLHDGGDDRSKTIAALPLIISHLQKEGYEFVTVSELIGLPSGYVPVQTTLLAKITNQINLFGFNLLHFANGSVVALAIISTLFGLLRFILVAIYAIVDKQRKKRKYYDHKYAPKVAAIVPAYNEETVIIKTIDSLLAADYKNLEIIVVDDGSDDKTYEVVAKHFHNVDGVRNFRKTNEGKSSAINFGLEKTDAEIVLIIDADTLIHHGAIKKLVRHFKDPRIGAVAGNAKVGNRVNFLTKMQAIEYITSQNLERRAFNVFNCIRVVAGAIGAWRKDILIDAGGFTSDTLAEDTDMTLRILRMGYRVEYDAEAIAYTEAPQTISTFMKQRFRWMHGTFQAVWKHIDTLFKRKYGMLGFIAIPDVLLFQVLFPLFSPMMDFFLVYNIVLTAISIIDHPTNYSTLALQQALFYYTIFLAVDYASAGLSFAMERKENRKLLLLLFFQRFVYRQMLYISAIKSTLSAIKGQRIGWNKLERHNTVPQNFSLAQEKIIRINKGGAL